MALARRAMGAIGVLCFPLVCVAQSGIQRLPIDPEGSSFSFRVQRRIGGSITGDFGKASGSVQIGADGQRQVHIALLTGQIEVPASRMTARIARGHSFFDADRFPRIEFRSTWHEPGVLLRGGSIEGLVTIRGITRRETFRVTPSRCSRPGIDCDIEARGSVDRRHYGMNALSGFLRPEVELLMKVRFRSLVVN